MGLWARGAQGVFGVNGLSALLTQTPNLFPCKSSAEPRARAAPRDTLAAPAPSARTVAGSLVWTCAGVNCNAPRGNSRPAIVCARLVRALGAVETFSADNQPLDAGQLQRCNASA